MCVAHAVADAVEATEVLLLWVETSRELGLFPGDTKGLGPDSLPCNNVCNTAFRNNETTSGCTGKTEYSHYHTHRGAHVTDGDPPPLTGPPPSQHVPTTTYNRFPGRRETRTAGRQWMARTSGFIRLRGWRMVRCRIARCVIPGGYLLLTVWHWRRRWSGQRQW